MSAEPTVTDQSPADPERSRPDELTLFERQAKKLRLGLEYEWPPRQSSKADFDELIARGEAILAAEQPPDHDDYFDRVPDYQLIIGQAYLRRPVADSVEGVADTRQALPYLYNALETNVEEERWAQAELAGTLLGESLLAVDEPEAAGQTMSMVSRCLNVRQETAEVGFRAAAQHE